MIINLAPVLSAIRFLQDDFILIRNSGAGQYIKGVWNPSPTEEIAIKAKLQPISNADLLRLPEAQRTEATHIIWTETELKTADETAQTSADIIVNGEGQQFRIIQISNRYEAGFTRAVGTLLSDRRRRI